MFAIEKNIELPAPRRGHLGGADYPFRKMKVGESFLVPINGKVTATVVAVVRRRVVNAASKAKAKLGFSFTSRTVKGGIRVWRIK